MFAELPVMPTLDNVETVITTTVTRCEHSGVDNAEVRLVRHLRNPHRVVVHCLACHEVWSTNV